MTGPTDERSDADLVTEILVTTESGVREEAYRTLLERYWKVVVVLLQARLPSARDAEDAAQEAFVRAWKSLHRLENPKLFLGWLLRIGQNLATDQLRRRRADISLETLDPAGVARSAAWLRGERGVDEELEREEEWKIVREELLKLPERYRTVVSLRYLQGLTNQEMARSLGEPEGTIRNRLFRALGKLRKAMDNRKAPKA